MPPLIAAAESLPTVDLELLWRHDNDSAGCARDPRLTASCQRQAWDAARSRPAAAVIPDQQRTMSRIESSPTTSLSSMTTRWRKFPRTIIDAACSSVQPGEA